MRKAILMMLLAVVSSSAMAKGVEVSVSDKYVGYIDGTSIIKDHDGLVHYDGRAESLRPPTGQISYEFSNAANCSKKTVSIRRLTQFEGANIVYQSPESKSFFASKQYVMDLLNYACDKTTAGSQESNMTGKDDVSIQEY